MNTNHGTRAKLWVVGLAVSAWAPASAAWAYQLTDPFAAQEDLANILPGGSGEGVLGMSFTGRSAADEAATAIAMGDINGDGLADTVVGAPYSDIGGRSNAGEAYVIFGEPGGLPTVRSPDDLNGVNGFRFVGTTLYGQVGASVAVGDVNGDGIGDVLVGAPGDGPGGRAFVIHGKLQSVFGPFPPALTPGDLDGTNGFSMFTSTGGARLGASITHATDLNGDTIGDIAVGAPGTGDQTGRIFAVFGAVGPRSPGGVSVDALAGTNGFRFSGLNPRDQVGASVAGVGDMNGDGFDDLLIGAPFPSSPGRSVNGRIYLVYGQASGLPETVSEGDLDGVVGVSFLGAGPSDQVARLPATLGDMNGDNVADFVAGAPEADVGALSNPGRAFVVLGRSAAPCPADLDGDGVLTLFDFLTFQTFFALENPRADFDRDGRFTVFDFLEFQNAFSMGCP